MVVCGFTNRGQDRMSMPAYELLRLINKAGFSKPAEDCPVIPGERHSWMEGLGTKPRAAKRSRGVFLPGRSTTLSRAYLSGGGLARRQSGRARRTPGLGRLRNLPPSGNARSHTGPVEYESSGAHRVIAGAVRADG